MPSLPVLARSPDCPDENCFGLRLLVVMRRLAPESGSFLDQTLGQVALLASKLISTVVTVWMGVANHLMVHAHCLAFNLTLLLLSTGQGDGITAVSAWGIFVATLA